jgi:hypothetical protein
MTLRVRMASSIWRCAESPGGLTASPEFGRVSNRSDLHYDPLGCAAEMIREISRTGRWLPPCFGTTSRIRSSEVILGSTKFGGYMTWGKPMPHSRHSGRSILGGRPPAQSRARLGVRESAVEVC